MDNPDPSQGYELIEENNGPLLIGEGVRHGVTGRREDPDWIRLEIFHPETHRRLLNRLLRRSRNPLS
ncbi:MAG: hypothetical protein Fur0042_30030 [Cyanophyceae cyanobacterium]